MLLNHREAEKWQPIQFVWSPWSRSEMNTVCILCVSNEQRAISILSIQFMSHYSSHIIRKSIVICVTIFVFLSIFPSLFVAQNKNLVTLWLVIRTSFAAFLSPLQNAMNSVWPTQLSGNSTANQILMKTTTTTTTVTN